MAENERGVDRRELIKRAVAGGLIWSTPLVSSLPAAAATVSPAPGGGGGGDGGGGGSTVGLRCGTAPTRGTTRLSVPTTATVQDCEAALRSTAGAFLSCNTPRIVSICLSGFPGFSPTEVCGPAGIGLPHCRPSGEVVSVGITSFMPELGICEGFAVCGCECANFP